jgi:hypothetical protein
MHRTLSLTFTLAGTLVAALPTDSTDMVMLQGSQVVQSLKLYVSGQKSRVEGLSAGPLGKIVSIVRKDRGVTWTLYLDKHQYTEKALNASGRSGRPDLSNFDLGNLKEESLGRETILGYLCTKMRVTMGTMPNGQAVVSTVWVADRLEIPLRLEAMGIVQENRNLRVVAQPASLFEIPAGFTKTGSPGMAAGLGTWGSGVGSSVASKVPYVGRQAVSTAVSSTVASASASSSVPAWKDRTNRNGGDYRVIDMATSDPTACKAACDKEAQCKSWTLVKPESPGGMGYCYLKDSVPPETPDDCCVSGLKGATGGAGGQTASQSSKYQLEMNVNRLGKDYRDFAPTQASVEICAEACIKESRCRAWTWVNANYDPPTGLCWLKNAVPDAAQDECCVSGVKK